MENVTEHTDEIARRNSVAKWVDHRLPIFTFLERELHDYPTPRFLNYWWNFGSLAGFMLVVMIVTGIVLSMQYDPNVNNAFQSVQRIMREVNYSWLIRYIHLNGASFFFIVTYIHIFRGLYYGSYKAPCELLWILGVVILLLLMATAFFGYVLPWSQMAFWGATVITNLFSAGTPTLTRFYALHFLLPFIIVGVVILHLIALHQHGSNNPLGIDRKGPQDSIPFHPYYTIKDLFGLSVFLLIYCAFIFYMPTLLGDPANFIPANPLQTPAEIVPEWYLLPFYAILRSIPSKLIGVIAMFGSLLTLFLLPWLDTSRVRSAFFRPVYKWVFWLLVIDAFALGAVGAHRPEGIWIVVGRLGTIYYFLHFLVLMPLIGWFERPLSLPPSISEAVLKKRGGGALAGAAATRAKP